MAAPISRGRSPQLQVPLVARSIPVFPASDPGWRYSPLSN